MAAEQTDPIPPHSGSIFLRMVWLGAFPAILLCIFVLAKTAPWTLSSYDLAVFILVAAAIVARAIDVLRYGGSTVYGDPATPKHVVLFAVRLVVVTAAVWIIAQSIAI